MVGKIELSDTLRTEAKAILSFLKGRGKHIYLLSGDDPSIAHNVGLLAGVEEANIFGGRRPEEKARFVEELKSNGHTVAMVGDGINDTIALGTADVGVAMGKGADAAGSAADVILLGDNLNQLKEAIMIGDNTMAKIRQNLGLALVYNILGIPIAAGILLPEYGIMLSPTFAGAMMACSSIVVVSNSLLLKNPSSR
jgi:P-type E1-E2 ATPase